VEGRAKYVKLCAGMVLILVLIVASNGLAAKAGRESTGQAPKGAEEPDNESETITLDDLVKTALDQNPSIKASQQTAEAKKLKIISEKTLPDPTVSFQTMGDPFPFELQEGDPSSGRFFSVEQEIPFPGKLGLKGKIASAEADVQSWSSEQTRRQVVADVKKAYYDHFLIHKSIEIIEENRGVLENFAQVAESKYRVGQGTQQDVLKAQVEISKLKDRREVLAQRLEISKALLNSLLYRAPDAPLGKPAEFEKAQLRYSLEALSDLALRGAPTLKMQEREIERSRHAVQLAKRNYYPDLAVGFTWVNREDMPEMYGLMVKAKVPLYFWRKQRPELDAAKLDLAGSQKQRDSVTSTLYYNIRDAYTVAVTSERLADLYKSTVVPQASLSLESSFASYQVGAVDFLTLLDSVVTLLDYQLKYYESITEFQKALAQLEPLVGIELTK